MAHEVRPTRQLTRVDRLRIRLGRCPTCKGKLDSVPQQDVESWHYVHGGMRRSHGGHGLGSQDGIMTGHNVNLRKRAIPHCPTCEHLFHHGWVYPANASRSGEFRSAKRRAD